MSSFEMRSKPPKIDIHSSFTVLYLGLVQFYYMAYWGCGEGKPLTD